MAHHFSKHRQTATPLPRGGRGRAGAFRSLAVLVLCLLVAVGSLAGERRKVGVVLSGGGAKGMAHIGVLKVIERAGIPVDYVVGTSMGAIVGGLYSIGYDANTLDSLVRCQDWRYLLSDMVEPHNQSMRERYNQSTYLLSRPIIRTTGLAAEGGLVSGHNLSNLFSWLTVGYHDSISFDNLPIPFACVATDMVDYSEVVFRSGWLSQAMRASMAIPGVFTPVRIDSMVLVDGGLKNNYPVDVARGMGADLIIGVTLQKPARKASELNNAMDILLQLVDFSVKNKFDDNVSHTDVQVAVDAEKFTSMSFSPRAIDSLITIGEEAAMVQWDSLMALKRAIGLDSAYAPPPRHRAASAGKPQRVRLAVVDFEGVSSGDSRYLRRKFGIAEGDSVSAETLEAVMASLRSDLMYSSAEYSLRQMAGGYWLRIVAGRRKVTQLNLGVRFDTEETVALQANSDFRLPTRLPVEVSVTGRLGRRYMANVAATVMPANRGNWTVDYTFRYNDINIYDEGRRDFNVTYDYHSVRLGLISFNLRNFTLDLAARWENFNYGTMLSGEERSGMVFGDEHLYSYNLWLHYNSENDRYFTTRGASLEAGYSLYTDDFVHYRSGDPVHVVGGRWRFALRLTDRFALQPSVYGRMLLGGEKPWCLSNFIGGDFAGHYVEQQMPFAGIGNIEMADNALVAVGLKAQQRIMDNNYVMVRASFALDADKLRYLWQSPLLHGYQLSWAYNSMFGPVNANLGYSSKSKRVFFYLNLGFEF